MDLDKIAGIVKILEESSLTELTIKEGDTKISLSKLDRAPAPGMMPLPSMSGFGAAPVQQQAPEAPAKEEDEESYIISPIVGTFYSAAAPDVPAYVRVGDHVKAGQTVCILEAMKLMNEIQADFNCEIEAVLVSNEQKVEYGQPLFRVKKL